LLQKDRGGHLTVTTTASFATKWLVPRLGGFQRANPEIDVRISTGTGLVDFSREDVDIGIRYGRGQWPNLMAERLVAEDVMPVCAPSLLKGPNGLKKPTDLKRFTLLHIGNFPDDWQVWLTAAGVTLGSLWLTACDKLNVAAIGNVVAQLHVHLVARRRHDPAWPRPVWVRCSNAASAPIAPTIRLIAYSASARMRVCSFAARVSRYADPAPI
jgi:DNA-binding transcriptional LysR family regulator